MVNPLPPVTAESVIESANDLSKTNFSALYTEQRMIDICANVLADEISLGANRTSSAIGRFPSEMHTYQYIAAGFTALIAATKFLTMQIEMLLKLRNPNKVLFTNPTFCVLPHDYLNSLLNCEIYVANDENFYRNETFILEGESPLIGVDPMDIQNGILPVGIDVIVTGGNYLACNQNQEILNQFYQSLPSGGTIIISSSNDYMALYVQQEVNPMWDLAQTISQLPNAYYYHMPTGIGYTVIIKN